jgi:hypothetical protein
MAWIFAGLFVIWAMCTGRQRGPALGIGFFMIGHTMESTVFPLELYFEHRNYLPGFGLFFALVATGLQLYRRFRWLGGWLLVLWLLGLSHAVRVTAIEVHLWSREDIFHLTAINRFPDSMRANAELARVMALRGNLDEGLHYARRAAKLTGERALRHQLVELLMHCLARPEIDPAAIATLHADSADFADDQMSEMFYLLVDEITDGRCPQTNFVLLAERMGGLVAQVDPLQPSPKLLVSLAILENHLHRYPQALGYVEQLLVKRPGDKRGLMMKLYFTSALELLPQRQETLAALQAMRDRGELNRQEVEELALFENATASH